MGRKKREAFYRSCLGKSFTVLTEGWESEEQGLIRGLSDNYLRVLFPSPRLMKNEMVSVIAERIDKDRVLGNPVTGN